MSVVPAPLVSEAEFLGMPESNQRIELLDGEVIVTPRPTNWHQQALGRLYVALLSWADDRSTPATVAQAPLDVRFAPNRILQPDVMVFLAPLAADVQMPIDQIPDLCVEVLSTDRLYDRVTKRLVYAAAGVSEYWVVDPMNAFVERWDGPKLTREEILRERLATPLLPGLDLDLVRLFANVSR